MKTLAVLAIVLAVALGVVACGSGGAAQPAATVTVTAMPTASTLDAAISTMNAETVRLKDKAVAEGANSAYFQPHHSLREGAWAVIYDVDDHHELWEGQSVMFGVMSYGVDHQEAYPKPSLVNEFDLSQYVDAWPQNPYTDLPMQQGTAPGDFSYTVDGGSFTVTGYGHDGAPVVTLP